MSDLADAQATITIWKAKKIRPQELSLTRAAASATTSKPRVEVQAGQSSSRWILQDKTTGKNAILIHAGIWAWNWHPDTGNFVPQNHRAPEGIPSHRIQSEPSWKCELAFAFDTSDDQSFYENITALEELALKTPGFNASDRSRRNWQDGRRKFGKEKFQISSKLFARRTPRNTSADGIFDVPYEVHPWLVEALKDQRPSQGVIHIPNPHKPEYFERVDETNTLIPLNSTNTPYFKKGDIVRVTFRLGFNIGTEFWTPEVIPIEFIRVGHVPENIGVKNDLASYPLDSGCTRLTAGVPLPSFDDEDDNMSDVSDDSELTAVESEEEFSEDSGEEDSGEQYSGEDEEEEEMDDHGPGGSESTEDSVMAEVPHGDYVMVQAEPPAPLTRLRKTRASKVLVLPDDIL